MREKTSDVQEAVRGGWAIAIRRRSAGKPRPLAYASLNRRGEIAMNAAAFRQIREPANVTLLYDARRRIIGVKFPVRGDENFFPARRYGRGRRMRIVRAARMLKQFKIEIEQTLVFKDVEIDYLNGDPMLLLKLDET